MRLRWLTRDIVLPSVHRIVVRWWRGDLPGDRCTTPRSVRLLSPLLLLLRLLLVERGRRTLRKRTWCTWELSRRLWRNTQEASDPSELIAHARGALLPLGSSWHRCSTWTRGGRARLALTGRLILSTLWGVLQDRATASDANQSYTSQRGDLREGTRWTNHVGQLCCRSSHERRHWKWNICPQGSFLGVMLGPSTGGACCAGGWLSLAAWAVSAGCAPALRDCISSRQMMQVRSDISASSASVASGYLRSMSRVALW